MKIMSGIYCITCLITGEQYFGSTANLNKRKRSHLAALHKRYSNGNPKLQLAYDKYGETAFQFDVLLYCDTCNLLLYEQMFLDNFICEFNIYKRAGSSYGRVISEHTRELLRQANISKKLSDATKAKMSKARIGNKPTLGYHHTEDAKIRIGIASANRVRKSRNGTREIK